MRVEDSQSSSDSSSSSSNDNTKRSSSAVAITNTPKFTYSSKALDFGRLSTEKQKKQQPKKKTLRQPRNKSSRSLMNFRDLKVDTAKTSMISEKSEE